MTRLRILWLLFLSTTWRAAAHADPGQTGGILLKEPFGARPFAMGQAYAALGDDIFAMSYNPASLSRMRESQIATQYTKSIVDAQLGYFGIASPLNPSQALGFSLKYLDAGKGDVFDNNGNSIRTVSVERDLLLQAGYAHSFAMPAGRLHLGAGATSLRSTIADEVRGSAYSGDLGGIYELPSMGGLLSLGAAAANIGSRMKYSGGLTSGSQSDPLPMTARMSAGYGRDIFAADTLSAGVEVDRVFYDNSMFESVGLEYDYHQLCAFRFGYRIGQDSGGLSLGLGFHFKGLSVDYGFGLMQTFNSVQQLSLNYRFTIPGIRYNNSAPPSPLETLIKNAEDFINAKHFFDARAEIERIDIFYAGTGAADSARLKHLLDQEVTGVLSRGSSGALFNYAIAFNRYLQHNWEEAVSNLEISLRKYPTNREIKKHLEIARKKLDETRRQLKLQSQARIATLLDLATQAFNDKDYPRALTIVGEILKLGPYAPAEDLRSRIQDAKRKPATKPATAPASQPPPRPASPETPQPTAADVNRAEKLYYQGVRDYLDNNLNRALEDLYEARRLNPNSIAIRNSLERLEKEYRQREKP